MCFCVIFIEFIAPFKDSNWGKGGCVQLFYKNSFFGEICSIFKNVATFSQNQGFRSPFSVQSVILTGYSIFSISVLVNLLCVCVCVFVSIIDKSCKILILFQAFSVIKEHTSSHSAIIRRVLSSDCNATNTIKNNKHYYIKYPFK